MDLPFNADDDTRIIDTIRNRDPGAPFAYVVTPNVDHIVRLQRSRSDLWPAYRGAWMVLCDSRILARLARQSGLRLPVLPGSDLTVRMFDAVLGPQDEVAIVGGDADALATLVARYGLKRVAHHNPPMGFINDPREVDRAAAFVVETRARYVFFAVGSPQQEILAHRIERMGGAVGVGLCVGASLDFLTGAQVRAPVAMQRMSAEWLFRLSTNPGRMWRRYLVDGPEIFALAHAWRRDHPLQVL
ncbi:WecB/TagA/CpsF family glycosyltransferase [Sphingomonas sp. IW22]|uniref:WecB/TagA/CpsF family glycosyltransferase n=1 Tax=Sphingomonas sp. IW22 TaxID=3242489 RepID=UPI0035203342